MDRTRGGGFPAVRLLRTSVAVPSYFHQNSFQAFKPANSAYRRQLRPLVHVLTECTFRHNSPIAPSPHRETDGENVADTG